MQAKIVGLRQLKAAVRRNPQKVHTEGLNFLKRGMTEYQRGITQTRWNVGASGGGAPVRTGTLKDSHLPYNIRGLQASIGPDPRKTMKESRGSWHGKSYAPLVHGGTKKMEARPWLDWTKRKKESKIRSLYREMLGKIVQDLAR